MLDSSYTVTWSPKAVAAAKAHSKKSPKSVRNKITTAIKAIDARLRDDPASFGEIYRSCGSVEEYLGAHAPVAIDFAVDSKRKHVHVRACHILSGPGPS